MSPEPTSTRFDCANVYEVGSVTGSAPVATDAAGAIADGTTLARAKRAGVDPRRFLENNDSYRFFAVLGDLIHTGPTNTNVMDLRVVLVDGREQ